MNITETSITPLTDGQEVVLSVLGLISGTLSVFGSSVIIFKILHNLYRATPYDRLLLALSSCDIIASLTFAVSPFLLPKETSQRAWAAGNDATANMLGFLTQFSFSAILYNGMLSYYYLLTVKYGVKRADFAQKYEPWMHVITLTFFLVTATVGSVMGFYNEVEISQGVWVANWPDGCETTDSCMSQYIGVVYAAVPTLFTFISLIVNNVRIYRHVHHHLAGDGVSVGQGWQNNVDASHQTDLAPSKTTGTSTTDLSSVPNWMSRSKLQLNLARAESVNSLRTTNTKVVQSVIHVREVSSQGFLYVGTFLVAYTAAGILRTLEVFDFTASDEGKLYWLLVIDAFLKPLQGFFNVFVYNRPNYTRFRLHHPDKSRFWAMRKALLDPEIPRLPRPERVSNDSDDICHGQVGYAQQPSVSGFTRGDFPASHQLASVKESDMEATSAAGMDDTSPDDEWIPSPRNPETSCINCESGIYDHMTPY
eukprot:Nitzschia sp. Nitz4//scaffold7_size249615//165961//167400//NITZ4_001190-RA/size249615-processed-gene-0.149-mRNA-1//1//CDS//3329558481//5332//frame0